MEDLPLVTNAAVLDFVPETYWDVLRSGAGRHRNELERRLRNAMSTGDWSNFRLPPVQFGANGGDYLPGFLNCEVEIARIALESTTWDVTSIRARPTSRGIAYRVVDEYESEYSFRPKSSRRPLSMGQLVKLIEGLTIDGDPSSPAALRSYQGASDADAIRELGTFVTVSSDFYPSLESWFEHEAERWVKDQLSELPRIHKLQQSELLEVRRAAQEDDPAALTDLGYRHFLGNGVTRSIDDAIALWRRATDLGDPRGTFNLAVCLQDGIGMPRNPEEALKLYERLAEQGYYVGLKLAGFCRSLLEGPTSDPIGHDAGIGYLGTNPLVRVDGKPGSAD